MAQLLASAVAVAAPEIAIEQPSGTNLTSNRVVGFGANGNGQITIPASLTGVIAIEAGENSSAALKIDGSVVGWGQVNNIPALTGVKAITVGGTYGHGLTTSGTLVNWNGAPTIPNTNGNVAVSAGMGWSAALQTHTGIVTWGSNVPTVPIEETGYVNLSAGGFHLLGLRNNGTVKAFGNNSNGQQLVPADLSGVTAVAAGRRFSLALLSDGTVRGWGFNDNGGGGNVLVPAGLNNVIAIAADAHALALKNDGTVVGWGRGAEGQLTLPAGVGQVRAIAAGGAHSLALVGSTLSYGPQLVGSTSVAKTFVIKNTGSTALTISGVNVFGAQSGDFVINTTGMASSVPAGGQTSFSVSFAPTATLERRTMLRVINNDADESSFETLLDGSAFTAPDIAVFGNSVGINDGDATPDNADFTDFGEVRFGLSDLTRTYRIINFGNASLNLGAFSISGPNAGDFFVFLPPDSSLLPGAFSDFQVRFTPQAPGLRQAVLSIENNDSDEQPFDFAIQGIGANQEISVTSEGNEISDNGSGVDYGIVDLTEPPRVRNFTIRNQGFGTLYLGPISFQGGQPEAFTVLNPPPTTIGSNGSATFQVRFAPTAGGSYITALVFENSDSDENPYNFPISGQAIAVEISVRGNDIEITDGDPTPSATDHTSFGVIPLSYERVREFVVRHEGSFGQLNLGPVSFTGAAAADYSVRTPPAASLSPGESTILRVAFAPTALGTRNATVNIANNDHDENPFDFAIHGVAGETEIVIEHQGTPLVHAGVTAWGSNAEGQLNAPPGLMGVVELDGGIGNTLALRADGTVAAWGRNDFGQTNVPANLRSVVAISASRFHALALRSDGTVVAWGRNDSGQCNVSHLRGIKAIAAGDEQTFSVQDDGTVLAFGANHFNQLQVPPGLNDVVKVAAGWGHTLALKSDGTVVCWGRNQHQECDVPAGLNNVSAISTGFANSMALRADGTVVAWGENDHTEISGAQRSSGITALNAGAHHILSRNADGVLFPWGWNDDGQANVPASIAPNAGASVGALAGGERHSVAAINPALTFASGENGPAHIRTLTIRNTGNDPLPIESIAIIGSDASDFTLEASGVPQSIGPGGQASLTVRSNATGGAPRRATLRVLNGDADEHQFDIALYAKFTIEISVSGNGVEIANGDSTPDLADHTDFGSILQGTSFTRTFTIRNSGAGNLHLGTPTFEFPFPAFEITQMPPPVIAGGGSATFQVRFQPSSTAQGLIEIPISFSNGDADENPFGFTIRAHSRAAGPGEFAGPPTDVTGDAVYASAVQASGHILLGGDFTQVHGQARQNLARLNPDGSLDTTFNPGANGIVRSIAATVNGQTLVAGEFTSIAGTSRHYVARLNADGTLDTSFDPNPSAAVDHVLVDSSERILLAGSFLSLQPNSAGAPIARPYLARVQTSGAVDTAFHPGPDGRVRALALHDDGRIVLGGDFLNLAPSGAAVPRGRLARIGSDGALDASLDPSANGIVRTLAIAPGAGILIGGDFSTLASNGSAPFQRRHLAWLNASGGVYDFDPSPNGPVWAIAWSPVDVHVGGAFSRFEPSGGEVFERVGFAIFHSSGGVRDTVVNAGLASGAPLIASITLAEDGNMLLGGRFDSLTPNGDPLPTTRSHFARLYNESPENDLRVLNGGLGVYWNRFRGTPFLQRASFDISTDGGNTWASLGNAVRIANTPAFQVQTSTPLPTAFRIRARGTAASGASTSQIEQFADFDFAAGPRREVRGNDVVISNGDSTPSTADHTDFGGINTISGFVDRSYTIKNTGALPMTLGQFGLSGANAADFSRLNTPANSVAPGASTQLNIRFDPSADGLRSARVHFFSNDPIGNRFDFSIQGSGLNEPPGAPILVSAAPLNGAARLSFSAAADGGSPILDYTASCTPGTASNTQNALTIDVVGLTNNTAYRCTVRARTVVGEGPASNALSVIPGGSGSSADLTISKNNGTDFVNGAAAVDYLIVVGNNGPADVVGARVQDAIGAGTDFGAATWACTPTGGAACPIASSGSGALDASVDLPAAASVQFLFSAVPDAGSETPISNLASVTPPATITDPNTANNIASDGPDLRGIFRDGFD